MRRRQSHNSRWSEYVPVATRQRNAKQLAGQLEKHGRKLQPVRIEGKGYKIAKTFWGSSWCANLECYSDFANRLPRGRTYARNGSVIDLSIEPGKVTALVSGSEIYNIKILVKRLPDARWQKLCSDCANSIDSLVELLQGRFSSGVMDLLCQPGTGMFPDPDQLELSCSCPDWALMCKHVAAALYGIGARLDSEPELLFTLRQVDHTKLISARGNAVAAPVGGDADGELAGQDLGAIFGIDLAEADPRPARSSRQRKAPAKGPTKQPKTSKASSNKPHKKKAAKAKPRNHEPAPDPWITAAELRQRGVPNHVVQAWLSKAQIEHSGERGIYVRNDGVEALVMDYLERKRAKRGKPSTR